ncbi:MAG: glycoside hydrolase family 88 protein [Paludibacter sp.]
MKKEILIRFFVLIAFLPHFVAIATNIENRSPLQAVSLIGDKLIRETAFKFQLEISKPNSDFGALECIDFGRTFMLGKPATAFAFTQLYAETAQSFVVEIEHNDDCAIWLNNELIYNKSGKKLIQLHVEERDVILAQKITLNLQKGTNNFVVKSSTTGREWKFYMQTPGTGWKISSDVVQKPVLGLSHLKYVDSKIAQLTNWLVIGPFTENGNETEILKSIGTDISFGKMYSGAENKPVTWTIPKVEVMGNVINPTPWGTTYQWNYHNGGMAWAMQVLAEQTGNPKFNQWATDFCDFNINSIPFVDYQVNTLNKFKSINNQMLKTPLLDFTLAPSLPLIYRLQKEKNFANRADYEAFIDGMLKYAKEEQIRFLGSNIYTRTTPYKYTTWVDDMFMGIPFLVQAANYVTDKTEKEWFLNDAAKQVLAFRKHVWDKDANLYMHANYSARPNEKLPYWSRANGWGIWATTEVLKYLPTSSPYYKPILKHFQIHVAALAKLQAPSGFWHNVLNRTDSKEEVSGTAIFTLAIARGVTNGWLNKEKYAPVAQKGWNALNTQIEADGTVHNICMGTMCSEDVNYYMNRPFYDDDTHGTFSVMFAGVEMEKLNSFLQDEKLKSINMKAIIKQAFAFSEEQSLRLAFSLKDNKEMLPRTIDKNGKLLTSDAKWWTSGFFPGTLWYLYEYSKNPVLKQQAENFSERVKGEQYTTDNHDVGFMIQCSYGNAYRLDPKPEYKSIIVNAAKSLATRFNPKVGLIRSWDWGKWQFPVIIDNMMNLELLFNATRFTGDSSYYKIAVEHATVNMKHHFRPDASCYHVVSYDTITGLPEHKGTWQGYSHSSSWARGQAWALYGYTVVYRETRNPIFLEMANRTADFLLNHPRMPKDLIPYWDFDAPNIPNEKRDASTASVMCSALIELSEYVNAEKSKHYMNVAKRQLINLSSAGYLASVGENGNFILKHSVGSMPHKGEVDVPLTYADYYFVEAMLR